MDAFYASVEERDDPSLMGQPVIMGDSAQGRGVVCNLPSFVVIAPQSLYAGGQAWGSDFLPGSHQGTLVVSGAEPVANIQRRTPTTPLRERELEIMAKMNQRHLVRTVGLACRA